MGPSELSSKSSCDSATLERFKSNRDGDYEIYVLNLN
jgi:hypothetical protein